MGGGGERRGEGAQEKQIGMFPEETQSTEKEEKEWKKKSTNESEAMIADLSHRCDSKRKNESNKDYNNIEMILFPLIFLTNKSW